MWSRNHPHVITGLGAVTPLGVGARRLHGRWRAGTSGIEGGEGACEDFDPVVANNARYLGGVLDAESATKAARFVRTCDLYGLPLPCDVESNEDRGPQIHLGPPESQGSGGAVPRPPKGGFPRPKL
jgi:hypothetical protein